MVTRRPATSTSWPGAWEFPGGKVEAGEDDRSALARELVEELDIQVEVGDLFWEVLGHDEGRHRLDFRIYRCRLQAGTPKAIGVAEIRWVHAAELAAMEFPTADRPAVNALIEAAATSGRAPEPRTGRIAP